MVFLLPQQQTYNFLGISLEAPLAVKYMPLLHIIARPLWPLIHQITSHPRYRTLKTPCNFTYWKLKENRESKDVPSRGHCGAQISNKATITMSDQETKPSTEDLGDKKEGEYIKLEVIG